MKHLTISLLASLALVTAASADPIHENYDGSLPRDAWNFLGKPTTLDGDLVLSTGADNPEAYLDCGLAAKLGNPSLNFASTPIDVTLDGLNIQGGAPADAKLFMLIIGADSPKETTASSYLKLRLSADGRASVNLGAGGSPEKPLLATGFTFPIQKLSMKVSARKVVLTITTAQGTISAEGELDGQIDTSFWENSEPYLVMKAVRRPGPGDCKVTIGGLEITPE